jgi:hypothetical protein
VLSSRYLYLIQEYCSATQSALNSFFSLEPPLQDVIINLMFQTYKTPLFAIVRSRLVDSVTIYVEWTAIDHHKLRYWSTSLTSKSCSF